MMKALTAKEERYYNICIKDFYKKLNENEKIDKELMNLIPEDVKTAFKTE